MLSKEEIKSLFEKKQYSLILQNGLENPSVEEYLGFLYLENQDYSSAEKYFAKKNKPFQQGFCKLLLGDKTLARKIWYSVDENPAISWGKVVLGIIDHKLEAIPTFLQVRNFSEMTLHYFFKANQLDFAYKFVGAKEFLADCNIESYKYIGRVLMDNKHEELAFEYFFKAIEVIPKDYEAYFCLAELYLRNNDLKQSKHYYSKVLEINPYHTPSEKILKKWSI